VQDTELIQIDNLQQTIYEVSNGYVTDDAATGQIPRSTGRISIVLYNQY